MKHTKKNLKDLGNSAVDTGKCLFGFVGGLGLIAINTLKVPVSVGKDAADAIKSRSAKKPVEAKTEDVIDVKCTEAETVA